MAGNTLTMELPDTKERKIKIIDWDKFDIEKFKQFSKHFASIKDTETSE